MFRRFSIKLKLVLLAGVPVIGALFLAALIARDAAAEAQSAAALGSIEDLAHLAAQMSNVVHELQFERAEAALELAQRRPGATELRASSARTDDAEEELNKFLEGRRLSDLPPRLARDLKQAQQALAELHPLRENVVRGEQELTALLLAYKRASRSLISATAALSQLSDDGELMRAISALVGVLEIKERASQEHAVLAHVFAANTFPPGLYKELVTLITEEADYMSALELQATDAVAKRFHLEQKRPEYARAAELRNIALNTLDENFDVDSSEWSRVQSARIRGFRALEVELNRAVQAAAVAKVNMAARSVRLSYAFGAGVVLTSALLALFIGRGVSLSVGALSSTAERVRIEKDFTIRAEKKSDDELGELTDAFNEMLSGIQVRETELAEHRNNLERLVEERTVALRIRNDAMRLVLDNVEQALATVARDRTISMERSRAFDDWFGAPVPGETFEQRIAAGDENVQCALEVAWEQVVEGFLPLDVALEQMPRRLQRGTRHYQLEYRPIHGGASSVDEDFQGALLVITDITEEIEQRSRDAQQREAIAVFERMVEDRNAFFQFVREAEALVESVLTGTEQDMRLILRAVHTLKGNCGSYGVTSVADVAHGLESWILDSQRAPTPELLLELQKTWHAFADRVRRLSGAHEETSVELAREELDHLIEVASLRAPHAEIIARLERLKNERVILRLRRAADQAKSLAGRLSKGDLQVDVRAHWDVRLPGERWAPFWANFVHVVRNAVDHGIEPSDERVASGKSAHGRLLLTANMDSREISIELSDDGRGIDWNRVRERARERGLRTNSEQDLVEALFADGLTTAEQVTGVSGRGVGLSAIRQATSALGGTITVSARKGQGTTFRFRFPLSAARSRDDLPARADTLSFHEIRPSTS